MEYQKKIEALKEILEDLKTDVSEYPSFEDLKNNNKEYALLIAIEDYLEYR